MRLRFHIIICVLLLGWAHSARAQVGPVRIPVTPGNVPLAVGNTRGFRSVVGIFSSLGKPGSRLITNKIQWISSNPQVATVDAYGTATGMAPGVTHIMARSGPFVGYTTLIVDLSYVTINPGDFLLSAGGSQQLSAIGYLTNGTPVDVSCLVTWDSSDMNVAWISPTGMVVAVGSGTATINGSFSGITGTVNVTVP